MCPSATSTPPPPIFTCLRSACSGRKHVKMYVCMCVCMCVCMHVSMHTCMYTVPDRPVFIHACMYENVCVSICIPPPQAPTAAAGGGHPAHMRLCQHRRLPPLWRSQRQDTGCGTARYLCPCCWRSPDPRRPEVEDRRRGKYSQKYSPFYSDCIQYRDTRALTDRPVYIHACMYEMYVCPYVYRLQ
jgi:hypothetical protein